MDDEERRATPRQTSKRRASDAQPADEPTLSAPEPPAPAPRRRKAAAKAHPEAANTVQVQIAVDDAYMSDFADIVKAGRELGLQVDQELPEVGVITGRMPADKVEDMAACKGVYAVERPRSFHIAPPEDDLQ
ncbi:MAG: hypothetical protein BWY52_00344 [Chloroflexi bacterium ADurb.Bin325]|nr:MAG: hypothetical protein BWY52_00344 [Chloroflexi bacterium ADurb.Bin325]